MSSNTLFWVAFIICFIPFLFVAVDYLLQGTYATHSKGIVIISGASTGIGRHAAEYLANNTELVVLAGVRKQHDAEDITGMKIKNLVPVLLDVADHGSCVRAVESMRALMKELNLPLIAVVNNAGISRRASLEVHDLEDIKYLFETNLFGAIDLTQLTMPMLRESKGRVLMVSSVAGKVGRPLSAAYTGSKFAMEGISDTLRREVSHKGIAVSLIEPAYVRTPIFDKAIGSMGPSSPYFRKDSAEILQHYEKFTSPKAIEKGMKILAKADEPIVTSEAIYHAITSSRPRTRYPVANFAGIPAYLIVFALPFIPDSVMDYLMGA
jgi:NAD(P)-dependent dehydrogenase (short-subunit alcohol dehydrogenase family)